MRSEPRQILSLVRIPISPLRLGMDDRCWGEGASTGVRPRRLFAEALEGGLAVLLVVVDEHGALAGGERGQARGAAPAEGVADQPAFGAEQAYEEEREGDVG